MQKSPGVSCVCGSEAQEGRPRWKRGLAKHWYFVVTDTSSESDGALGKERDWADESPSTESEGTPHRGLEE